MEESLKQPRCSLDREESIGRLPHVVFAASEAWRRGIGVVQPDIADLPKALGAKCPICGFTLSGEELLALAALGDANKDSVMLKRLRAGKCARENCRSSHYHLFFYDLPPLGWSLLFSAAGREEAPKSQQAPAKLPARRFPRRKFGKVVAAFGICLAVWGWWQWRSGGRIPYLREPEHFQVTPSAIGEAEDHS
jgi:hypothetical protein